MYICPFGVNYFQVEKKRNKLEIKLGELSNVCGGIYIFLDFLLPSCFETETEIKIVFYFWLPIPILLLYLCCCSSGF